MHSKESRQRLQQSTNRKFVRQPHNSGVLIFEVLLFMILLTKAILAEADLEEGIRLVGGLLHGLEQGKVTPLVLLNVMPHMGKQHQG